MILTPSPYQLAIFNHVQLGQGDAYVEAVAGSGKTSTLIGAISRIPLGCRAAFLAYNVSIADTLRSRVPGWMDTFTIHGFGLHAIRMALGAADVNTYKYYDIAETVVKRNWKSHYTHSKYYMRNVLLEYVHFVRVTLTNPNDREAVKLLGEYYGLSQRLPDVLDWVVDVLNEGFRQTFVDKVVDFDDMIWIPNVSPIPVPLYHWLFVDEAQDLSRAQRELVLKAKMPHWGRALFVLDPHQAIYSFAGADANSADELRALPGMTHLPLSITYRCPKSHVAMAQKLVPHIQADVNAIEGEVHTISYAEVKDHVQANDMVLCRVNAPLFNLCLELLNAGVPAKIQGKDMIKEFNGMLAHASSFMKKLPTNRGSLKDGCNDYIKMKTRELMQYANSALQIEMIEDQMNTVLIIADAYNDYSVSGVKKRLEELAKDKQDAVILSTIHKAKGLEADRVFLLFPDLIPHPRATSEWQRLEEDHVLYVALTRSKFAYYFVERPKKTKGAAAS